jgi:hypothetical protein
MQFAIQVLCVKTLLLSAGVPVWKVPVPASIANGVLQRSSCIHSSLSGTAANLLHMVSCHPCPALGAYICQNKGVVLTTVLSPFGGVQHLPGTTLYCCVCSAVTVCSLLVLLVAWSQASLGEGGE